MTPGTAYMLGMLVGIVVMYLATLVADHAVERLARRWEEASGPPPGVALWEPRP